MTTDELIASMNAAAETILKSAGLLADPLGSDTVAEKIPLADQVSAFATVAKWAESQAKTKPKTVPGGGKFAALKDTFHGVGREDHRRGNRSSKAEAAPINGGTA